MAGRVSQVGAENVFDIGGAVSMRSFNLETPAGWTMVWWWASVLIILAMFMML